jgi:hypothetical protein
LPTFTNRTKAKKNLYAHCDLDLPSILLAKLFSKPIPGMDYNCDATRYYRVMRNKYELNLTLYYCARAGCGHEISIPSESLYTFLGSDDSNFWCEYCQGEPWAELRGIPAQDIPSSLKLLKGFDLNKVPFTEPGTSEEANKKYKPYSKRSFLRQYSEWLQIHVHNAVCGSRTSINIFQEFDEEQQQYIESQNYEVADQCDHKPCQFLTQKALKPEPIECSVINALCDIKGPYGLCQTGDEAMILQNYLTLTGGEHFPMLIPQPSILLGKKRPDFIVYVPITKFQYSKRVVLIDRSNKTDSQKKEENLVYEKEGYAVKRILIDGQGSYFKKARELALWIKGE